MSGESSESDNIASIEDVELKEFVRRSDGNSESSTNSTAFRWSIEQRETNENKTEVSNTSNKNRHKVDKRTFLEALSLTRTRKSSPDQQPNVLIRKSSSSERILNSKVLSRDPLEGPSTRSALSLDYLKGYSTKRISSLDYSKRPSTRKDSSLNHLEESSTKRVSSLDSLDGSANRKISCLDSLKRPSTKRISSSNFLGLPEGSTKRVLSLRPLEGSLTRRVSSLDPLEGPSSRRDSPLDPLEGPSTRFSPLDPLEGPSTRFSSLDPLEGPSTKTFWFSDSAEKSLTSDSEAETNDSSSTDPSTEQGGFWLSNLLKRYSRQIRQSKYYLLFHVALFALPLSAGYMGSKYHRLCYGCPQLPSLVYMLGILGALILTIRIASILSKRYFAPFLTGREFHSFMVMLFIPFFLFLLVEMVTTYICIPVFIPPHKELCVKVFYNYAYYLNMIVLLVILLLMLIDIPGCFEPVEDE